MANAKDNKDKGLGASTRALSAAAGSGTKGYNEAAHNQGSTAGPTGSMGTQGGNETKSRSSSTGSRPSANAGPAKNLPTGVTPLSQPKPMGATPYVEGADPIGIAARFLGGIGGAVGSALTQGITGEDTTQSIFGEHLGKQTGWSADPGMTPGRDRAQRGTKRESFDQTTIGSATGTAGGGGEGAKAAPLPTDDFSEIQMMDRRKPGLKEMLETML